jgi:hypothetical protein
LVGEGGLWLLCVLHKLGLGKFLGDGREMLSTLHMQGSVFGLVGTYFVQAVYQFPSFPVFFLLCDSGFQILHEFSHPVLEG